jgi:hypothetical protein
MEQCPKPRGLLPLEDYSDGCRTNVGGPSSRFLQRQYKCYKNLDANIKQQKAITASILLNMIAHINLPFATLAEKAALELAVGAFFFAMRSCDYTDVSGPRRTKLLCIRHIRFFRVSGPHRTKPLRPGHIRFFRNNKALDLLDPTLLWATAILITFEFQKTDIRHETIHQHATILPNLCPVKAWAKAEKFSSLLDTCRYRTEPSHRQSTSHEGSSKLLPGLLAASP